MQEAGIPLTGFKECDIRGEFRSEVNEALAYRLGRAFGSVAKERRMVLGGDFRTSTPALVGPLKRGLAESGMVVYDLGQVSTPAYYFARRKLGIRPGIMVTASHSPSAYNGFKPILGELPITPEELEELKEIALREDFRSDLGRIERVDIRSDYIQSLVERFAGLRGRAPKVVFDCGNGATGWVIRDVLDALEIDATVLFPEPDGRFPNRSPDIAGPEDLARLQDEVRRSGAALGAGFDGDGDRVGFVDEEGRRIPSDLLIAWLARELLKRFPGETVVYDLKLSRVVPETVERNGGKAIVQKSGHTFIKRTVLETNALLGGEYTGHLFYKELEGGDDGLFSSLLVCALLAERRTPFSECFKDLPRYYSTPDLRIPYAGEKEALIQEAIDRARTDGARLLLIDGVKAEYEEGWGLMRASVTEPALTFRFEGKTKLDMLHVARRFLSGMGELEEKVWNRILRYASLTAEEEGKENILPEGATTDV